MQRAVRDFLRAAGLDEASPELKDTPARVTQGWLEEFLDGYRCTPEEALGPRYPAPAANARELVVVTGLRFHSMCPHHLLPWEGVAHVAYVPGKSVVGFGRIAQLLDSLAHRLVLQEVLARQMAHALVEQVPCLGAACIIEGRHGCLRLRGARQKDARTHTEAYEGVLTEDLELRRELWQRLARPRR
jgi:GTP cyclohydrolase I